MASPEVFQPGQVSAVITAPPHSTAQHTAPAMQCPDLPDFHTEMVVVGHNKWILPASPQTSILMPLDSQSTAAELAGRQSFSAADIEQGKPGGGDMEGSSSGSSRCGDCCEGLVVQLQKLKAGVVLAGRVVVWGVWVVLVWARAGLKLLLHKFVTNVWDGTDDEPSSAGEVSA